MTKKIHKYLMVGLFALVSLILPIITIINSLQMPEKPFSENENRYLQEFPDLNADTLIDKSFMQDFESYFSDRFVLREDWISIKNNFDKFLGKKEIKGIFTEDGRMIEAWREYDKTSVEANLKAMNTFAEKFKGVNMYFMLTPTAQEIYSETLPANSGVGNQKAFIKMCYEMTPELSGIDAYSSLYAARDKYLYYRTDHHWTSLGAYTAYTAAGNTMKYTPYSLDKFSVEHASNSFKGTLYSKTLDNSITPDIMDYYYLSSGEPELTMTVFDGMKETTYSSLYFRDYLDKKDKYSSFLGPNAPIIQIESNVTAENDNGSLLVIKDSYAHALVPFLTKNYSKITVIDLRYIQAGTLYDMGVNPANYDSVLFMYNVITFSEDINIKKLNFLA